jgi:hypothetical protein
VGQEESFTLLHPVGPTVCCDKSGTGGSYLHQHSTVLEVLPFANPVPAVCPTSQRLSMPTSQLAWKQERWRRGTNVNPTADAHLTCPAHWSSATFPTAGPISLQSLWPGQTRLGVCAFLHTLSQWPCRATCHTAGTGPCTAGPPAKWSTHVNASARRVWGAAGQLGAGCRAEEVLARYMGGRAA